MRYALVLIAAFVASAIAASLLMPLAFYIVGAGGQAMDPSAPGDQWIFLGGVAALMAGSLGALTAFALVGGLGLKLSMSLRDGEHDEQA